MATSEYPRRVWLKALTAPRRLSIESSPRLIKELRTRLHKRELKRPVAIPDVVSRFAPSQTVEIWPIDLLHSIGLITTPPIPNLADLSSMWSLYRYIWAFAPRPNRDRLYLSDQAKSIDFHQKGLFSDHMGVGITQWIMTRYFHAKPGIDADVAFRNPDLVRRLGLSKQSSKSPDYLFELPGGNWALVESKGTSGARSDSLRQLESGLAQLPAVRLGPHVRQRAFVVGIGLSKTQQQTRVYVVEASTYVQPEVGETNVPVELAPQIASEGDSEQRSLPFRLALHERYNEIVAAKLLSYAGAEGTAARMLGNEIVDDYRTTPPHERAVSGVESSFVGQAAELPLRGAANLTVNVFQGLEREVYDDLSQGRFRERLYGDQWVSEVWQRAHWSANVPQDIRGNVVFESEDKQTMSSLASDGSLLQIAFREA